MSSKSDPRVKKVSKRIKHMITFLDEMETMFFDIDKFYDGFRDNANQMDVAIGDKCTLHELYPHWNGPKLITLDKIEKMNKNYMDFIKKHKNLSFLELSDGLIGLIEEEKDKWDMVEYEPELLWKNCLVGNTYQESLLFDIRIPHDLLVRINNKLELIEKTKNAKKRLSVSKALHERLGKDSPLKNIIETSLYEDFTKGSMHKGRMLKNRMQKGRIKKGKKTTNKDRKIKGIEGKDFKIFKITDKPSSCRRQAEEQSCHGKYCNSCCNGKNCKGQHCKSKQCKSKQCKGQQCKKTKRKYKPVEIEGSSCVKKQCYESVVKFIDL